MKDKLKKYFILCGVIFIFSFSSIIKTPIKKIINSSSKNIKNTYHYHLPSKVEEFQQKYHNEDIIAILKIENTNLESIVTKTENNEYYLNHNLYREEDKIGTTFMDYRNSLNDRKILIYGHNSQVIETEFHLLENYIDESFYQNHKNIILETRDKNYIYKIVSVIIVTNDYQHMKLKFNDLEWKNHIDYLKNESLYDTQVNINQNDDLIILQTCYYTPKNSFLLIVGKKEKTIEKT